MKKTFVAATLIGTALIYSSIIYKKRTEKVTPFLLLQKKLENSGYTVTQTDDKGVFLLEKNGEKSYLFYDNLSLSQNSLFNLLNKYKELFSPHLYVVSDTTNSLYGNTKTHFKRWVSNNYESETPFIVHFSTIQKFKNQDEPTWESIRF